jgi:hypothetical protein
MLGIQPASGAGRGRVLEEMLRSTPGDRVVRRQISAQAGGFDAILLVSSIAGRDYVDSGSRRR